MLYTPKNAFSGHEYVPYEMPEKHVGIFGDDDEEENPEAPPAEDNDGDVDGVGDVDVGSLSI